MSEKSVQKRNYIIEKAREVFSQKGYLTVTMKDIVEACEISRGGNSRILKTVSVM